MYIYVYIYIYVYNIYLCIYIYLFIYILGVGVYTHMHARTCVHTHTHTYTLTHTYTYILCVCVSVSVSTPTPNSDTIFIIQRTFTTLTSGGSAGPTPHLAPILTHLNGSSPGGNSTHPGGSYGHSGGSSDTTPGAGGQGPQIPNFVGWTIVIAVTAVFLLLMLVFWFWTPCLRGEPDYGDGQREVYNKVQPEEELRLVNRGEQNFFLIFPFFPRFFFYRSSSALTSLVFHSDPVGPRGHLLCRGPSQCPFFVSGYSRIRTHVLDIAMRTSNRCSTLTPKLLVTLFIYSFFSGSGWMRVCVDGGRGGGMPHVDYKK